ncbi:guanylyltransferase/methyltransferase [Pteropine orthoreovirus]|nr:guanylyltransferase/methyltransferase [Pteropine orthoreovirus]
MAQIRGLRLAESFNVPSKSSSPSFITYDFLLSRLQCVSTPWTTLTTSSGSDITVVRLLFPLQGVQSPTIESPIPTTFPEWKTWMQERLAVIYEDLIRRYPISEFHGRHINPLICNTIVASFFSNSPYSSLLDHVMLRVSPAADILDANLLQRNHFWPLSNDLLMMPAGKKYWTFDGYQTSADAPCLFGKNQTPYADVIYGRDLTSLLTFVDSAPSQLTPLIHLDRPSYGPHVILPTENVIPAIATSSKDCAFWLLLESCLDQLRANQSSSRSTPVTRRIHSYLVVRSPYFAFPESVEYALLALNNASFCGSQLTVPVPNHPTCSMVATLVSQLSDSSKAITVPSPKPRSFTLYSNLKFDYPQSLTPFISISPLTFTGTLGSASLLKPTASSVRWQPQFDDSTSSPIDLALNLMNSALTLPVTPDYGYAWTGSPLFSYAVSDRHDAAVPIDLVPNFPADYFSTEQQDARARFRDYRLIADRSLHKDTANLTCVSQQQDALGNKFVFNGMSVAYMGASGTHPDDQPSVIAPWLSGKLVSVFKPSSIRQFGWDVTRGVILDVTHSIASGDFSFVYSDVDQVQCNSDDLVSSTRAFVLQCQNLLTLVQVGGSLIVKCNFPTSRVLAWVYTELSSWFNRIVVMKPLLSNNLEIYIGLLQKLAIASPPFGPSSSVVVFLTKQIRRYSSLIEASVTLPDRGASVTLDNPLTCLSLNFVNVTSVGSEDDLRALACFSLLSSPSTIRLSRHEYFDSFRTAVTSVVTPDSRRLWSRLAYVPRIFPSSLTVQSRSIAYSPPTLFKTKTSLWTLLSVYYDWVLSGIPGRPNLWMDLGTGPECRLLSKISEDIPVCMVDIRPSYLPMNCWKTQTDYIVKDYTDMQVILDYSPDYISAILTLGAASFSSGVSLSSLVRDFLNSCKQVGATKIIFQLNSPADTRVDSPHRELQIDVTKQMFFFPTLGRKEPYLPLADVIQLLSQTFPGATVEIRYPEDDYSWLSNPLINGLSIDTDAISKLLVLSQFFPLFIVHADVKSVTFSNVTSVGSEMSLTIHGFSSTSSYDVTLDGVSLLTISGAKVDSSLVSASLSVTNDDAVLRFTPASAGILRVSQTAPVVLPIGSTVVSAPDDAITVVWPSSLDYSDAGTNVSITCNSWFTLRLFAERDGEVIRVSDDKYDIRPAGANSWTLNVILDRSDAFYRFFLRDVQSAVPGQYIDFELQQLSIHVWDPSKPSFLSPPYNGDFVISTPGGPVQLSRPFTQIPADWKTVNVSVSVTPDLPSFLVPPSEYYGIVPV